MRGHVEAEQEMHLTEQIEYQEAGFAHSESEEGGPADRGDAARRPGGEVIYLRFAHDLTLRGDRQKVLGIPMRTVNPGKEPV